MRSWNNPYLIMLLVPLFWGGAFSTTKHVLTELSPLTASALRFIIAGGLLGLWCIVRRELNWQVIRQEFVWLLLAGCSGIFAYNYFFAVGLQYTTAITAALIIVVNPVFTTCMAVLFMGEAWNWRTALGVVLSLAGVSLVICRGDIGQLQQLNAGLGEMYLLGAVFSWVAYALVVKKLTRTMSAGSVTAVSTLLGAVMLTAASWPERQWGKVLSLSSLVTAEVIYLAVFATFVAFAVFNWGIQRIGATKASAYINLMPLNAVLFATLLYGEQIHMYHGAGLLLTSAGVFLTTQNKVRHTMLEVRSIATYRPIK